MPNRKRMDDIRQNLLEFKQSLPENVKLVAVTKTKSPETIMEAYNAGHRIFGENKAQELAKKYEVLPKDIEWHFIGHLQTNKVKYIAPFVNMVHSVDSLKLLKVINKEAQKNSRVIPCLLQYRIAKEETKYGLTIDEAKELLESDDFKAMENILFCGVMGMATFTDNIKQVREEFKMLKKNFDSLKYDYFFASRFYTEISMGMSDDYIIAIEEGSTMVRIGSKIFGAR